MMFQYSNEQLSTLIGVPIVTLLIFWTVTIFHKNRKKWSSYDIAVVAVLIQSILRNITILCYTALVIAKENLITLECCRVVVWVLNSVHTFQASSLTTLAVIALFTVRLYRKQQTLQQYLTPTHVIYHLFCLTTLCACVGVAALLAQEDTERVFVVQNGAVCQFMPFELDMKFNIFIIVLHIFLAMVSFTSFIFICVNHMKMRRHGFDYLKKSTSDLSDLSMSLTASVVNPNENGKHYYDTYTIHRGQLVNNYEAPAQMQNPGNFCNGRESAWNSDLSNISTTVSSTNSKRPCLNNKPLKEEVETMETGLYTMYPILAVCYLFNHLPLIVLCIFPRLVLPWTVSGVALWMGQLQDILIPIGLGMVDGRFSTWVSYVYKCSDRRRPADKIPPGVGLDGKFRHIGSQPQSLEASQPLPERNRLFSATEHKFPITNGSLYTSIDGRLPIIHNYRRHKDQRSHKIITQPPLSQNVNLHSSHLRRQDYVCPRQNPPTCETHHQNVYLPHINQPFAVKHICHDPGFYRSPSHNIPNQRRNLQKHISLSQDTLDTIDVMNDHPQSRTRLNRQKLVANRSKGSLKNRMSKSEDSLNDLQKDLLKFKENPEVFQTPHKHDFSVSSDDEYFIDNDINNTGDYDLTSHSSYSITTEANCDFDFYQNKDINHIVTPKMSIQNFALDNRCYNIEDPNRKVELTTFKQIVPVKHNNCIKRSNSRNSKDSNSDLLNVGRRQRITRSNSKRSLENFQAYIDDAVEYKMQRSSSFMNVEHHKNSPVKEIVKYINDKQQINRPENFNNESTNKEYYHRLKCNNKNALHSGSVPDFKKIFISDYI